MHRSKRHLFDHLIGDRQHARWDGQPKRPGGFQVQVKLEFGRRLYRQISRFSASKNAIDVRNGALENVGLIGRIRHQSTFCDSLSEPVDRGQPVRRRNLDNFLAMYEKECAWRGEEAPARFVGSLGDGVFNFSVGVHTHRRHVDTYRLPLGFERAEVDFVIWIVVWIENEARPPDAGRYLFEQPERLAEHRVIHVAEASYIAAGVADARHVTLGNGIVHDNEHDRDGGRRWLHCGDRGRAVDQDDVWIQADKLRRKPVRSLNVAAGPADFEPEVLPFNPSKFCKPIAKSGEALLRNRILIGRPQ